MAAEFGIYKCEICGNIVEVLHAGDGVLVCCGKDMIFMKERGAAEEGNEKHVPIIIDEKKVKVGSVLHPMEPEHYIEWIDVVCSLGTFKYFLKPGDKPVATFYLGNIKDFTVRAYCNVHGLWISSN